MTLGLAFVFLQVLLYLFPYCGLQVIVSFVAHVLIAIFFGVLFASILSFNEGLGYKLLMSAGSMVVMFLLQALTFTQDSGAPTLVKIVNSVKASLNYEKIQLDDYLELNDEERIVYNSKFNKRSDKEYFHIENMDSDRRYFLTRVESRLFYDETKFEINTMTNPHQIIEVDSNGMRVQYEIGDINNLLRIKDGGYKQWSVRKFKTELVGYEKLLDKVNRRKEL